MHTEETPGFTYDLLDMHNPFLSATLSGSYIMYRNIEKAFPSTH